MGKEKTQATENGAEAADAPKKKQAAPPANEAQSVFGDLDKVRQILFGAESQEIHERLVHLENHFDAAITALQEAVDRQFEAMQADVDKKHETLTKRLADEKEQRAGAAAGLGKDIQDVAQALQDNRGQLDQHIAETEKALRTALKDEAGKAAKDRQTRFDDLSARLEQAVADLGDAKTDRHGLADLLDTLSAGLRNNA